MKISETQNFENQEGFPYETYRFCETGKFRQNRDTHVIQKKVFDTRTFLKHEGPLTKFFGTVRQKCFEGKRDTPYYASNFFDTPNFPIH